MQPLGDVIGLPLCAEGGSVGGKIASSSHKNVYARRGVVKLSVLAEGRFDHLNGMKVTILAQEKPPKLG